MSGFVCGLAAFALGWYSAEEFDRGKRVASALLFALSVSTALVGFL